jgi:hypothetical protein
MEIGGSQKTSSLEKHTICEPSLEVILSRMSQGSGQAEWYWVVLVGVKDDYFNYFTV